MRYAKYDIMKEYILPLLGVAFILASVAYANKKWIAYLWLDRQIAKQKEAEALRVEERYEDGDDIVYTHPECSHDMKWRVVRFGGLVESDFTQGAVCRKPLPVLSVRTQDGNDLLPLIQSYYGPNQDWHESVMHPFYVGQLRELRYTDLDANAKFVTVFQMDKPPFEREFHGSDSVVDTMSYFFDDDSDDENTEDQ